MKPMKSLIAVAAALAISTVASVAYGQSYPNRAITVVVPFPPAGAADLMTRIIAAKLSEKWKQSVVVDNRPGGSGGIGVSVVARAAPDGYTIGVASSATHAVNPSLIKDLSYDPIKDFTPLTQGVIAPLLLVVSSSLNVDTLPKLVTLAKSKPDELMFAAPGAGSTQQLAYEQLKRMTGASMTTVIYKGSAPAVTDLVAGRTHVMFDTFPNVLPFIKTGQLISIGVTSASREPMLPDVPTLAEQSLPGYQAAAWFGFVGPAKLAPEITAKLNADIVEVLKMPSVGEALLSQGLFPSPSTPAEYGSFIKSQGEKFAILIKEANIKIDP